MPRPGRSIEPPARAGRDGQGCRQQIVGHHGRGLLIAPGHIGQGQQHMLAGGRGDAELAMGMLADLDARDMCGMAEAVEAAQAADPIAAEAEHVGGPAGDHAGDLALALQPLIGAKGDRHAPAQLLHQGDGRCGHRRLGIFDPEHLVPAVQQPDGFRQAPGLIGIDADPGLRPRGLAQRRQHLLLAAALDARP